MVVSQAGVLFGAVDVVYVLAGVWWCGGGGSHRWLQPVKEVQRVWGSCSNSVVL